MEEGLTEKYWKNEADKVMASRDALEVNVRAKYGPRHRRHDLREPSNTM